MARFLRRGLDAIYFTGGVIGAGFMVAILCVIVAQMVARWTGLTFPGATSYAGYCMAGASFFALAHALNRGAHIRVALLLGRLGRWRRFGEIWRHGVAALVATYFARYAVKTVYWSWKLGDVSQGQDATPLWIPQLSMAAGSCLLALALWDHLIRILLTGHEGVPEPDAAGEGG